MLLDALIYQSLPDFRLKRPGVGILCLIGGCSPLPGAPQPVDATSGDADAAC